MRNAQVCIVGLTLNAVDGLDSVGDIGEVDKGTVPEDNVKNHQPPTKTKRTSP